MPCRVVYFGTALQMFVEKGASGGMTVFVSERNNPAAVS